MFSFFTLSDDIFAAPVVAIRFDDRFSTQPNRAFLILDSSFVLRTIFDSHWFLQVLVTLRAMFNTNCI